MSYVPPPGAEVLGSGREPEDPPLAAVRRMSGRQWATALVTLLVGAVVAIVGYTVLASTVFGPASTVSAYGDAIREDDADAALALVTDAALEGVDPALLTTDVLSTSHVDFDIREVERDGDRAEVRAEVGGVPTTFRLVREGRRFGIFPRWRIDTPFSTIEVTIGTGRVMPTVAVQINGLAVPANDRGIAVFPGRYSVSVPAHYPFLGSEALITAPGGEVATAELPVTFDPDLQADAQREVDQFVERCVRYRRPWPSGCPYRYEGETRDIAWSEWTLVRAPRISVERSEDGRSLVVRTVSEGEVRFRARREADDPDGPPTVDEVIAFEVTGTVEAQADRALYFSPEHRRG